MISRFLTGGLFLFVMGAMVMSTSQATYTNASAPYRHVVMFQFQDDATEEQIDDVVKAFKKLPKQIDTIRDFEYGKNVSPEGLNKGLSHCFFVTFDSKADLEAYLPHQAHQDFVAVLKPVMKDVCVIDYIAEK